MTQLATRLFASGGFYPHGYCYLWDKGLVWLHVVSDLLIALAYFAIPIILLWLVYRRRDIAFSWMFILCGVFIVACGMTHVMEVWNLWHADYWIAGGIKAITAAASVPTAILLAKIVPQAVAIPTTDQWIRANEALQEEVHQRKELEFDLRLSEARYREIAELIDLTHDAIYSRTLDDRALFWNRAAERLYGWQKEEVLGKSPHAVLNTEFPESLEDIRAQMLNTGSWEGELVQTRRDGSKIVVATRWALQRQTKVKPTVVLETNRDITQRKQEETKFRKLLEAAPDAMVVTDQAGSIQFVNTQTEFLFGYTSSELVGQPVEILVPHRYRQQHTVHRQTYSAAPHIRAMREGLEFYGLRKDGSEFSVEISLSPIEANDQMLIVSAVRDTTQRRRFEARLREQEERLNLFVAEVTDYAVFMLDPDGRVMSWNAGAQRIKGYRPDEILGQHFSRFYPKDDLADGKPRRALNVAAEQGRYEDEGWRVRKDGSMFWASVLITALHDERGNLRGFGKVTRDMTARKEIEETLKEQRKQMARSNRELVETNRELESFSYSVSHDLRAPLRAIDGFGAALQEDCERQLDELGRDHLKRIRAATQRMGLLIDDLLSLARVTREEMCLKRVDVSALVRAVLYGMKESEPDRDVVFRVEEGLRVEADQNLLRVAMENLLSNAWKFTSKRTSACIEFGRVKSNGDATFYVRDDGVGFDPRYAQNLFGAFQRLHAAREFPGTGVGLATVQRIIRRHGGRIWAEGAVDRGATFYFTLPEKLI